MSFESVMPSSHLILCRPLLLPPPIPPSIRVFSSESALCIRWPKYWSFSFSISPSSEHPGLICFRMDWLDLPGPGVKPVSSDSLPLSHQGHPGFYVKFVDELVLRSSISLLVCIPWALEKECHSLLLGQVFYKCWLDHFV